MGVTTDWEALLKRIQGDLRRLDRAASGRLQVSLRGKEIAGCKTLHVLQGFLQRHSCALSLIATDLPQQRVVEYVLEQAQDVW